MSYLGTWPKQPADVKDYDVDYTDWLAEITPAVTITSVVVTVSCLTDPTDTALLNTFNVISSPKIKVWLSAGTSRKDYKITVRATMTGSPARVDEREFKIKVRDF